MNVTEAKDKEVENIAKLIKSYIESHPNASDSIEGITKWWIPAIHECNQTEHVLLAVDILINKSVLKSVTSNNGQIIYKKSN